MDTFKQIIGVTGYAIEAAGVAVIVAGIIIASARAIRRAHHAQNDLIYVDYRRYIGRSIILGLEFLIAGDIIRTVVVEQTLNTVAMLGLIIAIRAFLSLTLHLEVEGRLPWQEERPK